MTSEGKKTLSPSPTHPQHQPIPAEHMRSAGASEPHLETELADMAGKNGWISKFRCLTAEREVACQEAAQRAQTERCRKADKPVFETWRAVPDTHANMKSMLLESRPSLARASFSKHEFPNVQISLAPHKCEFTALRQDQSGISQPRHGGALQPTSDTEVAVLFSQPELMEFFLFLVQVLQLLAA